MIENKLSKKSEDYIERWGQRERERKRRMSKAEPHMDVWRQRE